MCKKGIRNDKEKMREIEHFARIEISGNNHMYCILMAESHDTNPTSFKTTETWLSARGGASSPKTLLPPKIKKGRTIDKIPYCLKTMVYCLWPLEIFVAESQETCLTFRIYKKPKSKTKNTGVEMGKLHRHYTK